MTRFTHSSALPRRSFRTNDMEPMRSFDAMEKPSTTASAIRKVVLASLIDPAVTSVQFEHLLSYLEHLGRFSQSPQVREACVDGIYLSRDLERLRELRFEYTDGGSTESHRLMTLKKLAHELEGIS